MGDIYRGREWERAVGWLLVALVLDVRKLTLGVTWNVEEIYNDDTGGLWWQYSICLWFVPALALRLRVNVDKAAQLEAGGVHD